MQNVPLNNLPKTPPPWHTGRMLVQALVLLPVVIGWPLYSPSVLRDGFFLLIVTWFVTVAAACFLKWTAIQMPAGYYRLHRWEAPCYEAIGILIFKKLVRRGPLHQFSPSLKCEGKKDVLPLRARLIRAETLHLFSLLVISPFFVYVMVQGWTKAMGWLLLWNTIVNIYPVMLQRYNRRRVDAVIAAEHRSMAQQATPGT